MVHWVPLIKSLLFPSPAFCDWYYTCIGHKINLSCVMPAGIVCYCSIAWPYLTHTASLMQNNSALPWSIGTLSYVTNSGTHQTEKGPPGNGIHTLQRQFMAYSNSWISPWVLILSLKRLTNTLFSKQNGRDSKRNSGEGTSNWHQRNTPGEKQMPKQWGHRNRRTNLDIKCLQECVCVCGGGVSPNFRKPFLKERRGTIP